MKKTTLSMICLLAFLCSVHTNAHHSFSAFNFSKTTEITGTLTRFDIVQPHVVLGLEITLEDGSTKHWEIESVVPRQWRLRGLDPEFANVGETVTLIGWQNHNGKAHMMLKTMMGAKGTMVVRDDLGPDSTRNGANSR